MTLHIDVPDDVLQTLPKSDLEALAQEALVVRLYQMGKLSSGRAATALGVSRRAFLDVLGRSGVTLFDEEVDLEAEAARA
jgi:predicted HTH domain antitoxin